MGFRKEILKFSIFLGLILGIWLVFVNNLIIQTSKNSSELKTAYSNENIDEHIYKQVSENKITIDAVILTRIYASDKAKWSKTDLEQWFEYLWYSGVDKIYLYDNFKFKNESLQKFTSNFQNVIYHDWSKYHPYKIKTTQVPAYIHAWENYQKPKSKLSKNHWTMHWDMDEYPFSNSFPTISIIC